MPKSSSKRKKEKNADFKKTKLKVGKKKAVADSFTDTSFKSKAISLPSQSISHDKTALLTNSRNVTFAELMTQLKHYSPGTRKDALLGLRDLFHRHPHLLPLHLGVLVNSVVRLLIDDSSVVRKALQNFLGEFIPMLHARDIHPFLPLLIVYTCSAMTHILDDIREDALKFMDLWVAAGGQVVVNGFWDKIIPNYVSLLTSDSNATNSSKNASAMSFTASASSGMATSSSSSGSGTSGASTKVVANASTGKNAPGSLKAKCDVLESLAGFLQEGLGGEGGDKDPYWFLRNFLGTAHARKAFNTARSQRGAHEDLSKGKGGGRSSKKRKASSGASGASKHGRSVRKKTDGEDEEESDSEEDDSDETDSDPEDEELSDMETEDPADNYNDNPESLYFDPSPIISFGNSHRHHQSLATFPMHPSVAHASIAQSIWGNLARNAASAGGQQQDPNAQASIAIKVFHQQGGASASGAGANTGVSGSGKTSGDQMGGVQGRLSQIKPLIATLHPLLLSVWLDTAPTVFSSTTTIHANHALTVVHLVLRIWGILWRAALAVPKKKTTIETDEEREQEREEVRWLDEFLQSLLRHVLIYFPFGKDTVGMIDAKVSALLQEMNTTYCELTSLFLLGSGVGRTQLMRKEPSSSASAAPSNDKKSKRLQAKADLKLKSSNRLSNKEAKKRQAAAAAATAAAADSSDYESEDEDEEFAEHDRAMAAAAGSGKQETFVAVQVVTPPWADQVVEFVLDALGWSNPEGSDSDDEDDDEKSKSSSALAEMSGMSTDFKSQHLVALLPTLWTLLNCLETKRREWVFEALMAFFDQAHVQSGSKRTILQFLALVIKLQSHPHYTGSFTINVPGAPRQGGSGTSNRKALLGLAKKDRKEQQASIQKLSKLLAASLLKLPKLLWDLGTERIETSQTVLDLLAWVTVIAGEASASSLTEEKEGVVTTGAAMKETERAHFVKTLQSYMALFFCVTVAAPKGSGAATRTIMGPFVKLPPALQRRAIEIVYYSGVVLPLEEKKARGKKSEQKQQIPLLAAVKSCCQVGELSEETRLYIQETLRIN
ncbi:hypothetical protein BGZ47_005505 [Haplosporangium gracile]|nr:hypothetical protein BGZ47_005505 [Haplosporangium gracile]